MSVEKKSPPENISQSNYDYSTNIINTFNLELDKNIDIEISGVQGFKQENLSSCGFGVIQSLLDFLGISLNEKELKEIFVDPQLRIDKNIFERNYHKLKRGRRNTFGSFPTTLIKGMNTVLEKYASPYKMVFKYKVDLDEIKKSLEDNRPVMTLFSEQQSELFKLLKDTFPIFNKYFGNCENFFTYGWLHYGLIVGLDGKNNVIKIMDPKTGDIENYNFTICRKQFNLSREHQNLLFHLANKFHIILKPRTIAVLKDK